MALDSPARARSPRSSSARRTRRPTPIRRSWRARLVPTRSARCASTEAAAGRCGSTSSRSAGISPRTRRTATRRSRRGAMNPRAPSRRRRRSSRSGAPGRGRQHGRGVPRRAVTELTSEGGGLKIEVRTSPEQPPSRARLAVE